MGCASRAFAPQRKRTSVSSTSRYELVPPPAPNTVARPTTLGACHVRLQLSTLCVPKATRASFPARKFISLVDLEQLKMPSRLGPGFRFRRNPSAARSSASAHVAGRSDPPSRTSGSVSRTYPWAFFGCTIETRLSRRELVVWTNLEEAGAEV